MSKKVMVAIAAVFVLVLLVAIWLIASGNFKGYSPAASPTVAPTVESKTYKIGDIDEDHFTTQGIPACYPVNPASWKTLFGTKNGTYLIDPANSLFNPNHGYVFEGVITGTNPLHTVEILTAVVETDQANLWDCGTAEGLTANAVHTLLFEFVDKKYQDQTAQGLTKPYQVITPFGVYNYADGDKPAWAPTVKDVTAPACPFYAPALSDPAGVQQPDGSFVGAPGKDGCDFVLVAVDGKTAVRYHGPIDSFPYPNGGSFYLFNPALDNKTVSVGIPGNPTVTNSWK